MHDSDPRARSRGSPPHIESLAPAPIAFLLATIGGLHGFGSFENPSPLGGIAAIGGFAVAPILVLVGAVALLPIARGLAE